MENNPNLTYQPQVKKPPPHSLTPPLFPYTSHKRALISESRDKMKELGITHIIQVTDIPTPRFPGEFIYKVIPVPDMDETNLIKHFPDTYTFIHSAIESGRKVLVHW
jgi:hypothetical protein